MAQWALEKNQGKRPDFRYRDVDFCLNDEHDVFMRNSCGEGQTGDGEHKVNVSIMNLYLNRYGIG